jgi:hypothetical protein
VREERIVEKHLAISFFQILTMAEIHFVRNDSFLTFSDAIFLESLPKDDGHGDHAKAK